MHVLVQLVVPGSQAEDDHLSWPWQLIVAVLWLWRSEQRLDCLHLRMGDFVFFLFFSCTQICYHVSLSKLDLSSLLNVGCACLTDVHPVVFRRLVLCGSNHCFAFSPVAQWGYVCSAFHLLHWRRSHSTGYNAQCLVLNPVKALLMRLGRCHPWAGSVLKVRQSWFGLRGPRDPKSNN